MSFLKSVVRGAGNELGRSVMRTVMNPVLKGKDATPLSFGGNYGGGSVGSSVDENKKGFLSYLGLLFLWTIIISVSMVLSNYFGTSLLIVFGLYYVYKFFSKETINEYDEVDVKVSDKRFKSGYKVEKRSQIVNSYQQPISKNKKIFYGFASIIYLLFVPISISSVNDNITAVNNMITITIDDNSSNKYDMSYITVSAYYDSTQSKYTHIDVKYKLKDIKNQTGTSSNHPVRAEFFTEDGGIMIDDINKEKEVFDLLMRSNKVVFIGPNYYGTDENKVVFVKNLHQIRETFNM